MIFRLSFSDETGRIKEVREKAFNSEQDAMRWMWICGAISALNGAWSIMELRVSSRCAARIPAASFARALNDCRRAKSRVMVVDKDSFAGLDCEEPTEAASCATSEFFFDNILATRWLANHRPDAAVIDVRPWDESCTALAERLIECRVPFLAVSNYPARLPWLPPLFQSVPWFEKPVLPASLKLALGCLF